MQDNAMKSYHRPAFVSNHLMYSRQHISKCNMNSLFEKPLIVRQSRLHASNQLKAPTSAKRTRSNANRNAQEVFLHLTSRYNTKYPDNDANTSTSTSTSTSTPASTSTVIDFKSPEWAKAKRYIYHATSTSSSKNPLSLNQIIKVLDYLDETFEDAPKLSTQRIIQSIPRIFRKDPDNNLKPTVEFLRGLYGTDMFYEFVERRPNILLTSGVGYNENSYQSKVKKEGFPIDDDDEIDAVQIPVDTYLQTQDLGFSQHHISEMKKLYPAVFQLSTSKIDSMMEFLLACLDNRTDRKDKSDSYSKNDRTNRISIGKMIKANPKILNLSLKNLELKVLFFQEECGFNTSEKMAILWKKYPGILSLSLEGKLRPTLRIIFDIIEGDSYISGSDIHDRVYKSLSSHPRLLALSPQNLRSKAAYFDSIDCNADELSLSSRIAISAPSVYSLSLTENIAPKIEALSKVWGLRNQTKSKFDDVTELSLFNSSSLSKRIAEYPTILTLSLDGNIQPSISFYEKTGYITSTSNDVSNDAAISTISINSQAAKNYLPARYLATSLFNRLLPRWNFYVVQEATRLNLQQNREQERKKEFDIQDDEESALSDTKPPLHSLAGSTDEGFCRRMNYDYATYRKFKSEAIPRLKFSSQFDTWLKTGRPIDLDFDYDSQT